MPTRLVLRQRQALCHDADSARQEWDRFRPSAAARPVLDALEAGVGNTQRCSYCADSRGADIDHYESVAANYMKTFTWRNLLLVCTPCNRKKSKKTVYKDGMRILIDPSWDDPWDHLSYISETGLLAPRFDAGGIEDRMGEETLLILDLLNHDAIAEGRKKAARRLRVAARRALTNGDCQDTRRDLLHAIEDDPYGLALWYAAREGKFEEPFNDLASEQPSLWRRFCSASIR